jgi:hypothetical protein
LVRTGPVELRHLLPHLRPDGLLLLEQERLLEHLAPLGGGERAPGGPSVVDAAERLEQLRRQDLAGAVGIAEALGEEVVRVGVDEHGAVRLLEALGELEQHVRAVGALVAIVEVAVGDHPAQCAAALVEAVRPQGTVERDLGEGVVPARVDEDRVQCRDPLRNVARPAGDADRLLADLVVTLLWCELLCHRSSVPLEPHYRSSDLAGPVRPYPDPAHGFLFHEEETDRHVRHGRTV